MKILSPPAMVFPCIIKKGGDMVFPCIIKKGGDMVFPCK